MLIARSGVGLIPLLSYRTLRNHKQQTIAQVTGVPDDSHRAGTIVITE